MKRLLIGAAAAALLAGCAEGRVLDQQEASDYCARHSAGNTLTMNPFGEDYATWMTYCNDAWNARFQPAMQNAIENMQRQQVINSMTQRPAMPIQRPVTTDCYHAPGSSYTNCTTR